MSDPRVIKVFIASPGDLAVERRAFKEVVDELNQGFGRGAHVTFEALGWEDALATVGRRPQSVINQDIDCCDIFVLVMWRRWGQPAPDAAPLSSYTEEEFYRALSRFEKEGTPVLFVFFKHIDPAQMSDPGPQLEKVLAFRKKLEQTRKVMYRSFSDELSFRLEIDTHLAAFVDGKCEMCDDDRAVPVIPDSIQAKLDEYRAEAESALDELNKLRAQAQHAIEEAEKARTEARDATTRAEAAERVAEATSVVDSLTLAEEAANAALNGRIEEARQQFAKVLDGTTNLGVLYLGFEFYYRIGELAEAERLMRRSLAIGGPNAETVSTAKAYSSLGVLLLTRGDLDRAEAMHRKSLEINEKVGQFDGIASDFGNIGNVLNHRGDFDGAEAMHRKSLELNEKLGRRKGIASNYGNLGNVVKNRGDSEGAESMYRKALEIHEKLGWLVGMASDYGNLGVVLKGRGDLDGAEMMFRKSLEINKRLSRLEGTAINLGNLGSVLRMRGDLDGAESMYREALEINESLGRIRGMASNYANLGNILRTRGDGNRAQIAWSKSRDLYARFGAKHREERVQRWIDRLPKLGGDTQS